MENQWEKEWKNFSFFSLVVVKKMEKLLGRLAWSWKQSRRFNPTWLRPLPRRFYFSLGFYSNDFFRSLTFFFTLSLSSFFSEVVYVLLTSIHYRSFFSSSPSMWAFALLPSHFSHPRYGSSSIDYCIGRFEAKKMIFFQVMGVTLKSPSFVRDRFLKNFVWGFSWWCSRRPWGFSWTKATVARLHACETLKYFLANLSPAQSTRRHWMQNKPKKLFRAFEIPESLKNLLSFARNEVLNSLGCYTFYDDNSTHASGLRISFEM